MLICSKNGQSIRLEMGLYASDTISLKNLVKVYLNDRDMYWSGFASIGCEDANIFQHKDYSIFYDVDLDKSYTESFATQLLAYVDHLLEGKIKNPAYMSNQPTQRFLGLLDNHQKSVVAAIIYRMKLRGGTMAVVGTRPFLSLEELAFLEECLQISPYLKKLNSAEILVKDFIPALQFAYPHILYRRIRLESLMDLNSRALAYVYDDVPKNVLDPN